MDCVAPLLKGGDAIYQCPRAGSWLLACKVADPGVVLIHHSGHDVDATVVACTGVELANALVLLPTVRQRVCNQPGCFQRRHHCFQGVVGGPWLLRQLKVRPRDVNVDVARACFAAPERPADRNDDAWVHLCSGCFDRCSNLAFRMR